MTDRTIAAIIDDLAVLMAGVTRTESGPSQTWSFGGQVFSVVERGAVELRLDPAVATAASKTPGASASRRGDDWVRFEPGTLEGYDLDRLEAWFGLAQRRAAAAATRA